MSKKQLYELGAKAKREIGEHTDKAVLQIASKKQGVTLYDLAKTLGWTRGRVLGSIRRLSKQGRIKTKTVLRHGKVVRTIHTAEYQEPKPEILEVPYEIIALKHWKEAEIATVYALNRLSFLIEPIPLNLISDLYKNSLFNAKADLQHLDNKMLVKLPAQLIDFYLLRNSDITLSSIGSDGDNVLVTIEATSLPLVSSP